MYKLRKKYQRKFNKLVKEFNQALKTDNQWLGRFELRQKASWWEEFSDGSGCLLHTYIRCIDKSTNYYKDYHIDYAPWSEFNYHYLWHTVNKFIVDDSGVWFENPKPCSEGFAKDYTDKKIPDKVMKMEYNFI